jgi:lysozyme
VVDTYDRNALGAEIIRDEGLRAFVYDDATGKPIVKGSVVHGNPTIGVGRNLSGKGLSRLEVFYLLSDDMLDIEGSMDASPTYGGWWRTHTPARQRAMLNMSFNLGQHGFDAFKHFAALLKANDFTGAAKSLENSLWWHQVGQRAVRIQAAISTGAAPGNEPSPMALDGAVTAIPTPEPTQAPMPAPVAPAADEQDAAGDRDIADALNQQQLDLIQGASE